MDIRINMKTFDTIKEIPKALLENLASLGFSQMTQIQQDAIPPVLDGKDILAQSKTGSGKTLAFGLPSILRIKIEKNKPQILIVAPTRELSEQIAAMLRKIAAYKANLKMITLYGGVPLRAQAESLAKGAHIVIGTPGRLLDHLGKKTLALESIQTLVLDEADRMLDMGFYEDIIKINAHLPHSKQTLLFSATFPQKIEKLARTLLKEPLVLKVDTFQESAKIDEIVYETTDKFKTLTVLIQSYKPQSLLIFCNTKAQAVSLADALHRHGHSVIDIHGDLEQKERNESVIVFSNGSKRILVATDVASRGLDIKGIELIVNYDLPFDKEVYTHRIGRTGRADATGTAISLYDPKESAKCSYITSSARTADIKELHADAAFKMTSDYDTLCINGGKKNKLRAADILGTLCKEIGIGPAMIGKINITETKSYIALHHLITDKVLKALKETKIKKKKYTAWIVK